MSKAFLTNLPMPKQEKSPLPNGLENLGGAKFNRWTVKYFVGRKNNTGDQLWFCECICGNTSIVARYALKSGGSKSCGCFRSDWTKLKNTKHGGCGTSEYASWKAMWQRCSDENSSGYSQYKDRAPPAEWRDFSVFLKDMGPKPDKNYSIERIDNNKSYGPNNCKWGTSKEQSNNRKNNRLLTFKGKTQTIKQWAEELGVSYSLILQRITKYGYTDEEAIREFIKSED